MNLRQAKIALHYVKSSIAETDDESEITAALNPS